MDISEHQERPGLKERRKKHGEGELTRVRGHGREVGKDYTRKAPSRESVEIVGFLGD